MVKVIQENEGVQPGPGGDAGRKQYGKACESLKILVFRELMKMIDRVRQPGKLALVSELHNPVQIVLLGGQQPGVFPQEPDALQRAGEEILPAKCFGGWDGFWQRSKEWDNRFLLPEEPLVRSLENFGLATLALAAQDATRLQSTRHVEAGMKQLLYFCLAGKKLFIWQNI